MNHKFILSYLLPIYRHIGQNAYLNLIIINIKNTFLFLKTRDIFSLKLPSSCAWNHCIRSFIVSKLNCMQYNTSHFLCPFYIRIIKLYLKLSIVPMQAQLSLIYLCSTQVAKVCWIHCVVSSSIIAIFLWCLGRPGDIWFIIK